jgi:hypothetical protein
MESCAIPDRVRRLPLDTVSGLPVPAVAARPGGVVTHGRTENHRALLLAATGTCSVCAEPLDGQCFHLSAGCGRPAISTEAPAHLGCLLYAVEVCPHLSGMPEGTLKFFGHDHAVVSVVGDPPFVVFSYRHPHALGPVPTTPGQRDALLTHMRRCEASTSLSPNLPVDRRVSELFNAPDSDPTVRTAVAVLLGAGCTPGYGRLFVAPGTDVEHVYLAALFRREPQRFTGVAATLARTLLARGPDRYPFNLRLWQTRLQVMMRLSQPKARTCRDHRRRSSDGQSQ